ncbi:MAG: ABC transporter ATP-binding protein [Desulfobacteraceae bacterium]|nr:MAG: ABC transporter ATP-binding protein [Desulfobacteraceae bacterium]
MNIRLTDLVKRFGALEAVSHVSLDIKDGELFTLLGPSGCGKTTILRLIGGFHKPDCGEIYFGDRDVSAIPPYERHIGMVFQNYALWPHMTIFDNVAYGLKIKKTSSAEVAQRVNGALSQVKLTGLEKRYPGQLSGGQQQRVALARALVLNPDVLLLDEPLSNLDAKIRQQVRAEIRKLQKELAITAIYVTHDQEEALTLSDRIAVLDHGKLQQIGSPRDLYERPGNLFVADFIGINNLIAGEVKEIREAKGWVAVETRFGLLKCLNDGRLRPGNHCKVSVRPEVASICNAAEASDDMNLIAGKVSFASYIGNAIRYDIELDPETIFKVDVQNPWNQQPFPIAENVHVHFPAQITLGIPA